MKAICWNDNEAVLRWTNQGQRCVSQAEAILRLPVRQLLRFCALMLVCLSIPRHRAAGQETTSLIPDATVLPRGGIGIRVSSAWTRYDGLFGGPGGLMNVAATLNTDSLGPRAVPQLGVAQAAIRSLASQPNFTLTAGKLVAIADSRIVTAPLVAQYGLTSRLTLGVVIPFVDARTVIYNQLNPATSCLIHAPTKGCAPGPLGRSNVGPNPAIYNASHFAATAALVTSLRQADSTLQAMLTACLATPSGSGCTLILQQQAAVQSLIQTSGSVATSIETLYGTNAQTHPGQPFVPMDTSLIQQKINQQIQSITTQFQTFFQGSGPPISGNVTGAAGPAANAEFQYLLTLIGLDTLQQIDRTSIGDISVGATYQFVNTYGDTTAAAAHHGMYRVVANATVRLPTGQTADRSVLFDMPTGYGQLGVSLGGAIDAERSRWSATATGSYTQQLGSVPVSRLPNPANALLPLDVFPLDSGGTFSAGNVAQFSVSPRFRLAGFLAITGEYAIVHTGGETYTLRAIQAPEVPSADFASLAGLGASGSTIQQVGLGFTYSTIVGPQRTHGRLPVEVSFQHLEAITASGGPVPKTFRDQIDVRVYFGRH